MTLPQIATGLSVYTTLGDDAVRIASLTWSESLGCPFDAEVQLLSESPDIPLKELIKQPISIHLDGKSDDGIWLHGFVSRFESNGVAGDLFSYRAKLVSCFGLMQKASGCRIFQDLSTLDIIKKVFDKHGFSGLLESRLSQTYAKRPYCVQYGETDYQFLQRLMEMDGIYYSFEYAKDKHTMVLADDLSGHHPMAGYETVAYRDLIHDGTDEYLSSFAAVKELGVGIVTLNDYDFEKPRSPLLVQQKSPNRDVPFEWYEYAGGYKVLDDGQRYARIRMESEDCARESIHMNGNARGLRAGSLFTLSEHPNASSNKKYLITSSVVLLQNSGFAGSVGGFECSSTLCCQDTTLPFRCALSTPRPSMLGPHLATVSGKAGEEIWTDPYGRIKVQFPWDRDGKSDELSSCWIRVSQAWTGKSWGAMSLPRIGDEVIVEFLEGNPDRPIVTGRVFNSERMPPEKLAAAQAKTVFRTRSTKGGDATAFHELTFDDTKDKESILFQSERDFSRIVENNDTLKVGFEKMSPGDRSVEIYNNENIKVGLGSGAGTYTLEAATSIVLKCGDSQIEMTPSGVTITASSITLKATGEFVTQGANVTIKADAALKLSGGASSNFESGGNVVVKGAMVNIN